MRLEKEIIQSPIFDRLRQTKPQFETFAKSKLYAIAGDVRVAGLDLADEERRVLVQTVHVVVHLAATVSFDEPLDEAVEMNCLGAMNVLTLVHSCRQLETFVHISTAYVNSNQKTSTVIQEKVGVSGPGGPSPFDDCP